MARPRKEILKKIAEARTARMESESQFESVMKELEAIKSLLKELKDERISISPAIDGAQTDTQSSIK